MIAAGLLANLKRAACGLPFLFAATAALAQPQPEPSSGFAPGDVARGRHAMVVSAHPLATRAGIDVLRRGGTAMDAAVTVQLVLGLVEPQSSGLGGGGFLLYYAAREGRVRAYDGRETAPAAATGTRFLQPSGAPLGFFDAVISGKSVGVPGLPALLGLAHAAHGNQPWASLFSPAIALAREGFPLSPRLHALLAWDRFLSRDPAAAEYFYRPDGTPKPVGTMLRNPAYAATLEALAAGGPAAFYRGDIAADIVRAVAGKSDSGDMTLDDLAAYRALERDPVCGAFRVWRICGMSPPSSGGLAVLQMLGIMERVPRTDFPHRPLEAVHLFSEAGRLAYADRDRYVGDPAFVSVPVAGLLAPRYLDARAALVSPVRAMGRAEAGRPLGAPDTGAPTQHGEGGTTHFSIVDAEGNAVAMTSSIEFAFGSHTMVRGFLLNNQLTDFAVYPAQAGRAVANRVEGGKRPRSSMSPTLVFDAHDALVMATGSPGGHMIINYVAKSLAGMLEWRLAPAATVALPNFGSRNGPTELEKDTPVVELAAGLGNMGHEIRIHEMTSGVHLIVRTPSGWIGAADPRREGLALGD